MTIIQTNHQWGLTTDLADAAREMVHAAIANYGRMAELVVQEKRLCSWSRLRDVLQLLVDIQDLRFTGEDKIEDFDDEVPLDEQIRRFLEMQAEHE